MFHLTKQDRLIDRESFEMICKVRSVEIFWRVKLTSY